MNEIFKTSIDELKLRQMIKSEIGPVLDRLELLSQVSNVAFLGVKEVSKLLGLEESTIYSLTSQRKIPHYKPGKKLLFKQDEIEQWILEHRCTDVNSLKLNDKSSKA